MDKEHNIGEEFLKGIVGAAFQQGKSTGEMPLLSSLMDMANEILLTDLTDEQITLINQIKEGINITSHQYISGLKLASDQLKEISKDYASLYITYIIAKDGASLDYEFNK